MAKPIAKYIFAISIFCVSTVACCAQQYDHVKSIKINNVDITKPISRDQLNIVLNNSSSQYSAAKYSECTGNFDVSLRSTNPTGRLEYYQEDNKNHALERVFSNPKNEAMIRTLRARLWIDWSDLNGISQDIRIGDTKINNSMTIMDFSSKFPLSYKKGQSDKNRRTGPVIYEVLFGLDSSSTGDDLQEEAPPYTPSVQFLFMNGKLKGLSVLQGIGC